ncbi:MAG: hypothetical protein EOP83_13000 [Verrucomicrobiaceae bacterium]|nr:MAG: hypothetical protein EOP83_13000 [Verrucomicrobiaceae bacterium]
MLFQHREDYDAARTWFHERNISTGNDVIGHAVRAIVHQSPFNRFFTAMANDDQMIEINLRWRQAV